MIRPCPPAGHCWLQPCLPPAPRWPWNSTWPCRGTRTHRRAMARTSMTRISISSPANAPDLLVQQRQGNRDRGAAAADARRRRCPTASARTCSRSRSSPATPSRCRRRASSSACRRTKLTPGFYDIRVTLDCGRERSVHETKCTFGWKVSQLPVTPDKPADFDAFWKTKARTELAKIPIDAACR